MTNNAAETIDVHVGARLRELRARRDVTQVGLAELIGVTFQQVQKYERGVNRISASRLYKVAEGLGVSQSWFFEGLEGHRGDLDDPGPKDLTPDAIQAAHKIDQLPQGLRRQFFALVAEMQDSLSKAD